MLRKIGFGLLAISPLLIAGIFACNLLSPFFQGIYERTLGDQKVMESFNLYPSAEWVGLAGDYIGYVYYWTPDDKAAVKAYYETVFPAFQGDFTTYIRDNPKGDSEAFCKGSVPNFTCIDLIVIDALQVDDMRVQKPNRVQLPQSGTLIIYSYTTGRF